MKKNAIILAAGTASRFVPLSVEVPKGLIEVRGEVLIERQIRQLNEAGINDITLVVGYMAEQFNYLEDKFGVSLVLNEDYDRYNNTSSIVRVLDRLSNTYILTSDNYYPVNPFIHDDCSRPYYSAMFADGPTNEYCISFNSDDRIVEVVIGGKDKWYMYGPAFFTEEFSHRFIPLLKNDYSREEIKKAYWEDVFIEHIAELDMNIRRCNQGDVQEFDSLDELREFDSSYVNDTRSAIVAEIANALGCEEKSLTGFTNMKPMTGTAFRFCFDGSPYEYVNGKIERVK